MSFKNILENIILEKKIDNIKNLDELYVLFKNEGYSQDRAKFSKEFENLSLNDEKLLEVAGGKGDVAKKLGSIALTAGMLSSVPSGFAMEGDMINGIIPPRSPVTHIAGQPTIAQCLDELCRLSNSDVPIDETRVFYLFERLTCNNALRTYLNHLRPRTKIEKSQIFNRIIRDIGNFEINYGVSDRFSLDTYDQSLQIRLNLWEWAWKKVVYPVAKRDLNRTASGELFKNIIEKFLSSDINELDCQNFINLGVDQIDFIVGIVSHSMAPEYKKFIKDSLWYCINLIASNVRNYQGAQELIDYANQKCSADYWGDGYYGL